MPATLWTHPSVLGLGAGVDPAEAIVTKARCVVFGALESGWQGPPFDPFSLADYMNVKTVPTVDVLDARTVPLAGNRYRIEFNPDRPYRRIRYSIFHELAHTLFTDCGDTIRQRGSHNASRADEWQLESLCNIAAAEFLLPVGVLGGLESIEPEIDGVLRLREQYEASAEASLLRLARLTSQPSIAFACHWHPSAQRYVVDYAASSPTCQLRLPQGAFLPLGSAAEQCTAIGYTAKDTEVWPYRIGQVQVECLGIAPYPRDVLPRVIGFLRPIGGTPPVGTRITCIRGDATQPRSGRSRLLLQLVNDAAFTWGAGFAAAVRRRWPLAQKAFTEAVQHDRALLKLGRIVPFQLRPDLTLVSLIAQRGYGDSPRPRIRYAALQKSLEQVCGIAKQTDATVHMPRIGTGEARGAWPVVEELIRETLLRNGIGVIVYDLPVTRRKPQGDLPFKQS